MPAEIIDGTRVAQAILDQTREEAANFHTISGRKPCLATVLVGDDPASHTYVRMKANRCRSTGLESRSHHVPTARTTGGVIDRSPILGKPVGMLLLARDATVTYCHSRTANLPQTVASADVVIAAVGRPDLVNGHWINPKPWSSTPATTRGTSATSNIRPPPTEPVSSRPYPGVWDQPPSLYCSNKRSRPPNSTGNQLKRARHRSESAPAWASDAAERSFRFRQTTGVRRLLDDKPRHRLHTCGHRAVNRYSLGKRANPTTAALVSRIMSATWRAGPPVRRLRTTLARDADHPAAMCHPAAGQYG